MKTPEKRAEPRTPTKAIMVRVNGQCHQVYGFARDISSSGMGLRTFTTSEPYPIEVGEKVILEFRLPDSGRDITCEAEAVWNAAPDGETYTIMHQGFRFTAVEPALEDEIRSWVGARA